VLRNIFAISEPPTDKVKRCDQGTGECEHVCEDTPNGIKCSCFDGFRAKGPSCIGNPYAHSHIQIRHCIFHIFISLSQTRTHLYFTLLLDMRYFRRYSPRNSRTLFVLTTLVSLCLLFSMFPFDMPVFHLPHSIFVNLWNPRTYANNTRWNVREMKIILAKGI